MTKKIPVEAPEYLELTGKGYNVMLQSPDNFGNLKVDLLIEDAEELVKLQDFADTYGMKIHDEFTYMEDRQVKTMKGKSVTLRAKYVDSGQYPRTFIKAQHSQTGDAIQDLISHGAEMTVRFKVYAYKGGVSAEGFKYPAGNGFQLESVRIHNYEPYRAAS